MASALRTNIRIRRFRITCQIFKKQIIITQKTKVRLAKNKCKASIFSSSLVCMMQTLLS
uniref:Uncharacterized protein n=1 Tax=Solanum tuberosum TaxID=4113 RepID=M1AKB7_SOLTU